MTRTAINVIKIAYAKHLKNIVSISRTFDIDIILQVLKFNDSTITVIENRHVHFGEIWNRIENDRFWNRNLLATKCLAPNRSYQLKK